MIPHKNFILTSASWLLLVVSAHASMMVKDRPADPWERVFKISNRTDLPSSLVGAYVSWTNGPDVADSGAGLPGTTSTFPGSITAADVRLVELIGYDRVLTDSMSGVTRDSPALTLTSVGLAILSICGAAEPGKRRRRRQKKETAGDTAPAVDFTKEMIEA